jgi:hypothetical protein
MKVSLRTKEPLSTAELARRVIAIARDVPRALREDDLPTLASYRTELDAAVDMATGANLAVVEVAHALFKYALPSAREEVVDLRVLLDDETGASMLERIARDEPVQTRIVASLSEPARGALARLEERGVIVRRGEVFTVPASQKKLVRDEIEPLAFRSWRLVENARQHASVVEEKNQPDVVAALLGVSEAQARAHLSSAPLTTAWNRTHARVRWQRKEHVPNATDPAPAVQPPQREKPTPAQRTFATDLAPSRRSLLPSDRAVNRPEPS